MAVNDFSVEDRLTLHELAARYGNTIDERNWERFATVFTADCHYELVGFGKIDAVLDGIEALTAYMVASQHHPISHHVTNVEIDASGDVVKMQSKIIAALTGLKAGSADYHDTVVKTPDGWRIATRIVSLRG